MATTKKGARVEPGIWKHPDGQGYLAEINYTDPRTNRRIRERKSIHRIDLAREWRQTRQTDALRGEVRRRKDGPKPMTFSQLADEYLEIWSQVKKKPSSYIRDQTSVKRLRQVFGRRVISDITRRDVERYFAGRSTDMVGKGELRHPVTPATLNRELCCLKNMLRKAVDWGYLASNPAGDVKQSRESPPEFDYLTEDEIDRLLEGCGSPQLRAIVTVAVHTGMRRGEIFGLEWRDVAFDKGENGLITVRKPKNDDTRYIPMNQAVREALSGYPKRIVAGKLCPWVFSGATGSPLTDVKKGFAKCPPPGRYRASHPIPRPQAHLRVSPGHEGSGPAGGSEAGRMAGYPDGDAVCPPSPGSPPGCGGPAGGARQPEPEGGRWSVRKNQKGSSECRTWGAKVERASIQSQKKRHDRVSP